MTGGIKDSGNRAGGIKVDDGKQNDHLVNQVQVTGDSGNSGG